MITLKQLLGTMSAGLVLFLAYKQNETITKQKIQITELKAQSIALQDSLFNTNADLGRYEMTLEILKDGANKKLAEKFEHILTTETE